MRGYTQGGRFNADFESHSISHGINQDLQQPVGTNALWYVYDPDHTKVDPVYDVGSYDQVGRRWRGPYSLPVVRSIITQGSVELNDRGFYNTDLLHLTLNSEDIEKIAPGVVNNTDLQNRGRIVWKNQVYRPMRVQQSGIVAEKFSLVVVDCLQVMNDELINDPQFSAYAVHPQAPTHVVLPPGYGYGTEEYGDPETSRNGYGA